MALSMVMIGVGMFLASPLALYLLKTYGLKGTFIINAGLSAQLCVCAMVCRPSGKEIAIKKHKTMKQYCSQNNPIVVSRVKCLSKILTYVNIDLLINVPFLGFLFSTLTWNFLLAVCVVHLPNYIERVAVGKSVTVVMIVFSVGNSLGRFLGALLVIQRRVSALLIHILVLTCGGIFAACFQLYKYLSFSPYVFAGIAALSTGLPNSIMTAITLYFVGIDNISSAHGLAFFFSGLGFLAGAPIAG